MTAPFRQWKLSDAQWEDFRAGDALIRPPAMDRLQLQHLRLRSLELAVDRLRSSFNGEPEQDEVVRAAEAYFWFLTGGKSDRHQAKRRGHKSNRGKRK